MDEEQDGGSKPPISTKLTSIEILGFFYLLSMRVDYLI